MNNKTKWFEQYNRILRWYAKFKSINNGIEHNRSSECYKDEIYAFFINCYHLKDWIKNDRSLKITNIKKIVEKFIDESTSMTICRDICNGLKHLNSTHKKASKDTRFGPCHHNLNLLGQINPIYSAKYTIISRGKNFDAFSLATSCINEWKAFIRNKIDNSI
jgi:hypothetical protein